MSVAYRASTLASYSTAGAAKNVTIPSTVVVGDLMIIDFAAGAGGAPSSPPAGWTLLANATDGVVAYSYYRVAQSGDASSVVTVSQGTGTRAIVVLTAYSGVDTSTPIGQSGTASESGTSATHSGATLTTVNTSWIHRALYLKDGGTASTTITPPGGFTMRQTQPGNGFSSTFQVSLSVADSAGDVAGGSQSGTWTVDQSTSDAVGIACELVPLATTVTVRPIADITTTGTTFVGGASAFAVLADNDPATYVEVPATGSKTVETKLDVLSAPPNTVTVKFYGAGSPATMSVQTKLMQGTTTIADFGTESAVVATETTKTYTLNSTQQGNITNLADLRVRQIVTVT